MAKETPAKPNHPVHTALLAMLEEVIVLANDTDLSVVLKDQFYADMCERMAEHIENHRPDWVVCRTDSDLAEAAVETGLVVWSDDR